MSNVGLRRREANSEMIVAPDALPAACGTLQSYYLQEGNGQLRCMCHFGGVYGNKVKRVFISITLQPDPSTVITTVYFECIQH